MNTSLQSPVPEVLRLLGDQQRWRLLQELAQSDLTVGELAERLGKPQSLVSYHLAELRKSGLVSSRRSSADARDTYCRFEIARCAEQLRAAGNTLSRALHLDPGQRPIPSRRRRLTVLFLCTGNSARSQMAEALLEHRSGGGVRARSAGSDPKALHPNAVRVMAERGIDIAGRKSKHLDRFARSRFDHVITLCDKVREVCPEFPDAPRTAHWSMPDPSVEPDSYPAFVRLADELENRIDVLLAELSVTAAKEVSHGS